MELEREHFQQTFLLLTGMATVGAGVLLVARLATVPLALPELVVLLVLPLGSAIATWWGRRDPAAARWLGPGILVAVAGSALLAHATLPTSRFALQMLGVVVTFASLLMGPRGFTTFGVVLLAGVLLSRGLRVAAGMEGEFAAIGFINVVCGYLAFGACLHALDRQHRHVAMRLHDATQHAEKARDAALAAVAAKTRFLANMSHELRTPLNAILGYSELLEEEAGDDDADTDEAIELLQLVRDAGSGLLIRLDEVLEAARSEARGEGVSQVFQLGGAVALLQEPSTLEGLDQVDRALIGWRGTVTAGAACIATALLGAGVGVLADLPPYWDNVGLTVLLGVSMMILGLLRRPQTALLVLVLGGSALLAYAIAGVPEASDMATYAFFLCALGALLLRVEALAVTSVVVTASVGAGNLARYPTTHDAASTLIPTLSVALVAISLVAASRQRREHRRALHREATRAETASRLATAADTARTEFLGRMSRDVRTPLTTITGYTELLFEDLPASYHHDLQRIHRAASHLGRIVDDVLDMATLSQGELQADLGAFDLVAVCHEALDLANPHLGAVTLSVELPDAPVEVWADRTRTCQVLVNLLSNAGKYAAGHPASLTLTHAHERVHVTVRDEGPGISEADLGRIFEPFERLHVGDAGGSGLGLAIAQRLARAQGGDLRADSSLGKGSRFTLTVPTTASTHDEGPTLGEPGQ